MENKRKMKCFECDGEYEKKLLHLNGIITEGYICKNCKDVVFDKKQSRKYLEKMKLKETIEQERKIIRIGSSMGITLPEKLNKYGMKIGKKVKLEAIDEKSIKITLI